MINSIKIHQHLSVLYTEEVEFKWFTALQHNIALLGSTIFLHYRKKLWNCIRPFVETRNASKARQPYSNLRKQCEWKGIAWTNWKKKTRERENEFSLCYKLYKFTFYKYLVVFICIIHQIYMHYTLFLSDPYPLSKINLAKTTEHANLPKNSRTSILNPSRLPQTFRFWSEKKAFSTRVNIYHFDT